MLSNYNNYSPNYNNNNNNNQYNHSNNNNGADFLMGASIPMGAYGYYIHRNANKALDSVNEYNDLRNKNTILSNKIKDRENVNQNNAGNYEEQYNKLAGLSPDSEEFKNIVASLPNGDEELKKLRGDIKTNYSAINNHPLADMHMVGGIGEHVKDMNLLKGRGGMLMAGGALLGGSGLAATYLNSKAN